MAAQKASPNARGVLTRAPPPRTSGANERRPEFRHPANGQSQEPIDRQSSVRETLGCARGRFGSHSSAARVEAGREATLKA